MDLRLRGKVAVVTGGSDGLGRAAIERLTAEGAAVATCARRADRLRATAEELRRGGGEVLDVVADVTRPDDLDRFIGAAIDRFGRIDILVNNAGRAAASPFERVDDAAWQADLDLKLFAAIRCIRLCVPAMRRAGGGRIINILNTAAKTPPARSVPTSVTRAAGMALTKALSRELGPERILVNAICIGLVKSGQVERRWEEHGRPGTLEEFCDGLARGAGVPVRRMAEASELAALVAFLASEQAAYITGTAINFDGGLSSVV
jgi:NAD(P)-dependent dehydrogenase (short-subunit alcohol dehydrogenase family)